MINHQMNTVGGDPSFPAVLCHLGRALELNTGSRVSGAGGLSGVGLGLWGHQEQVVLEMTGPG